MNNPTMMRELSRRLWIALAVAIAWPAVVLAQTGGIYDHSDDEFGVWSKAGITQAAAAAKKENEEFKKNAQAKSDSLMDNLVAKGQKLAKDGKLNRKTCVSRATAIYDEFTYVRERVSDRTCPNEEFNQSMTYLLLISEQPSLSGLQNPYVELTKAPDPGPGVPMSFELKLAVKIADSGGNLTPADVFELAVEACRGDYALAMLAAHDLLKEVAYGQRGSGFPPNLMIVPAAASRAATDALAKQIQDLIGRAFQVAVRDYGGGHLQIEVLDTRKVISGKLVDLRPGDDPEFGDKMGPWYHIFGVLFLSAIAEGGQFTAERWAELENLARHVLPFVSKPDFFKERITRMTGKQSGKILDAIAAARKAAAERAAATQAASEPPATQPAPPQADGLGKIISTGPARLIRANIPDTGAAICTPGKLFNKGGAFKKKPVDRGTEPPIRIGPVDVAAGGTLSARIVSNPPVQGSWAFGTWNSAMVIYYRARLGNGNWGPLEEIVKLTGQLDKNDLKGGGTWPGPGRIMAIVFAPQASGPLTGVSFDQGFHASAEILSLNPAVPTPAGLTLAEGDQIQTDAGAAVVAMPDGSKVLIRPNSRVTFTSPSPGIVRVNVLPGGSIHIDHPPGGSSGLEVQLGNKVVRPKGTDFVCESDGKTGAARVSVGEGAVEVADDSGVVKLPAGKQADLASGKVTDAPKTPVELVGGLKLRDLLTDDFQPAPAGRVTADFPEGKMDAGWVLEDPGSDAKVSSPANGTLVLSVPHGNDLSGRRGDAPRLLHKVTGDFDLQGQLLLACKGNHLATAEFAIFSPGSRLGAIAGQMSGDDLVANYRIVGGGWNRVDNLNKLASLDRPHRACPDAPDKPVWVRLTRRGDCWRSYWSLDGKQWCLSSRQEILAPETLFVGWAFKRMAYDGLTTEPAVSTLSDVTLTSAARGGLGDAAWDLDIAEGAIADDGNGPRLALDGSRIGHVTAWQSRVMDGDFDVTVRFSTAGWDHKPGQNRQFNFFAATADGQNHVYIALGQHDEFGVRYTTDLRIDGGWGRYQYLALPAADTEGHLRIVRRGGLFLTFVWNDGQWAQVSKFEAGFAQPVLLGLMVSNDYKPVKPAAFSVQLAGECLRLGASASAEAWLPEGGRALRPTPLPEAVKAPPGVTGRMFNSTFSLGRLFFGPDGVGYVFSSQREKDYLLPFLADGMVRHWARSDLFAGINLKSGMALGQDVLVVVDAAAGTGNRYGGLYQFTRDGGQVRQWKLARPYSGLGDVVAAPQGGLYFSEFESVDNVFHLAREGTKETPLVTKGEIPPGMVALAVAGDGTVYALNQAGPSPFGGLPAVYRIAKTGEARLLAKSADGTNFGGLAISAGGPLGKAVLVSEPKAGRIVALTADGPARPIITGLANPGAIRVNPANGDLWVVTGEEGKGLCCFSGPMPTEAGPRLPAGPNAAEARELVKQALASKDLKEKVELLTRAVELDPGRAVAWNNRGVAYLGLGRNVEAVADFSKAIELDPKLIVAYRARGRVGMLTGQLDQALADLNQAVRLDPDDPVSHSVRAQCHFRLKAYDKAWIDVNVCKAHGGQVDAKFLDDLRAASGRKE